MLRRLRMAWERRQYRKRGNKCALCGQRGHIPTHGERDGMVFYWCSNSTEGKDLYYSNSFRRGRWGYYGQIK